MSILHTSTWKKWIKRRREGKLNLVRKIKVQISWMMDGNLNKTRHYLPKNHLNKLTSVYEVMCVCVCNICLDFEFTLVHNDKYMT